ncbi:MAG: hypothetical protein IJ909_01145 [Fibrobacter sp.]|nr:hypothetical protein [Fibrobacter sp.]
MKSVGIYAYISDWTCNKRVEKDLQAHLWGRADSFRELLEFQKEAKKVFNAAYKASKAGQYVRYDVVVMEYADDGKTVKNSEVWKNEGYELFYEEDDGKKAVYLEPDTRYTRETWDMVLHADVVGSLAEAGV